MKRPSAAAARDLEGAVLFQPRARADGAWTHDGGFPRVVHMALAPHGRTVALVSCLGNEERHKRRFTSNRVHNKSANRATRRKI